MAGSPPDVDALDIAALKGLVLELFEKIAARDVEIAALREEVRRLKGLKGRPDIRPSGMDKKAQSRTKAKSGRAANKVRRGAKKGRVSIDERRVVKTAAPPGSRFKSLPRTPIRGL